MDSDDLSKSFLVRRFISGRRSQDNNDDIAEEDEALAGQESGTIRPSATARGGSNWGARGISVSADNTLDHHHHHTDIDASEIADPAAFEDETDDDDDPIKNHKNNAQHPPPAKQLNSSGTNQSDLTAATTTTTTANMADNNTSAWAAESNAGKALDRD